jgi:hypothetical protein
MAIANGYILILPEDRHTLFLERSQEEMSFAEPVPEFAHSRNAPLLCLIVTDGRITHVARGKRGVRAGTDLRRLNVQDPTPLTTDVSASAVGENVPKRLRHWVVDRFASGGLLSQKMFAAVVDALLRLAPSSAPTLRRFSQERAQRIERLSQRSRQALAAQKAAVTTALCMAGLSRDALLEWDPGQEQSPASFLDGLPTARLREDAMVQHDLMVLPGHDLLRTLPCAAAVFESRTCRLTVLLANRQPLEEQTGTDLVYFNERFRSFVMVQYKAMERANDESFFRLPDAQLEAEIQRMRALQDDLAKCVVGPAKDEYRLTDNPFFLKLCPRIVFNPDDAGLIPGMYLPLGYWDRLSADPSLVGPRGGKSVSYRNVGRYMDNTEFVSLVAKAWVGTTVGQSNALSRVIRSTVETGKAVAIGIKTDLIPSVPQPSDSEEGEGIFRSDAPEPPDENEERTSR